MSMGPPPWRGRRAISSACPICPCSRRSRRERSPRALPASAPDQGEGFDAILRDLDELLLAGVTHWQHPRYFAYFPSGASEPAILAELLAATLNSVALLWRTAPASTELEGVVAGWVAELLGLPAGWHGHIEDSASTSTMAAIIAARQATGRELVVASDQAHSSVEKAATDARDGAAQGARRRGLLDAGAGGWAT